MNRSDSPTIPKYLVRARQGDKAAREKIAQWLYDEAQGKVLHTLKDKKISATESSLLGSLMFKLVRGNTIERADGIGYLRRAILLACRDIVVDRWRKLNVQSANRDRVIATNEKLFRKFDEFSSEIDELIKALEELATIHPRKAIVVNCRFFLDMTVAQTAEELGVSESTVEADWRIARAWLYDRLRKDL